MKKIILGILALTFMFASCEYDNYDAPSVYLNGQLKCDGENFNFDGARSIFLLQQEGYGKVDGGITMRIDDEGRYQQLLFNNKYYLTLVKDNLPFEVEGFISKGAGLGTDTIILNMNSNKSMDFEIKPYYKIKDLVGSVEGNNIAANFSFEAQTGFSNPVPKVSRVYLYLSTSKIVNSATSCQRSVTIPVGQTTGKISIPVGTYRNMYINNFRDYVFYRVAVELDGIPNYYLFSEIKRLDGLPD